MKIDHDFVASSWSLPASVVGIGTFDGVHLAHQRLIERTVERARALSLPSAILTFDPLPMEVLKPGFAGRLTSLERKLEVIDRLGPDHACVVRFDLAFAAIEPDAFVDRFLLGRLGAREIVIGFNFTFGHRARGTPALLEMLGKQRGFATHTFPPFALEGEIVSSSAVRARLGVGDVEGAARLLDRSYVLEGEVVSGDGRARKLGFPTANLAARPSNSMIPGPGVYSGAARLEDGIDRRCVINIGVGPTFGGTKQKVEVHLLDFEGELSGKAMQVSFARRLRDERKFASEEDLRGQIARDVLASRAGCGSREARP